MAKVIKFGGSSLADAAQFRKVADIVKSDSERRYVVPSAPGKRFDGDTKVTDMLYGCYDAVCGGSDARKAFAPIAERFDGIIADLGLDLSLESEYKTILADFSAKAGGDYAASRGEYLNGIILARYLGFDFVDAAKAVKFDENGEFDAELTDGLLAEILIGGEDGEEKCAVIPGFYGAMPDGRIKTFSRGGSDFTGSIIAKAVKAELYENFTDVSGFLAADPRIVDNPDIIRVITYRELRELSYMGATVLHEDSIFPLKAAGIPINIRNTNAPSEEGTLIVHTFSGGYVTPTITGITGKKGFSVIHIEKDGMNNEIGFVRRVLSQLEKLGVNFEHLPTGIDTLSIVLNTAELKKHPDITDHIREAVQPGHIVVEQGGLAMIAIVGRGMIKARGTAARIFSALDKAEINVRTIDQGSCEYNVIVGVDSFNFEKAIRALYDCLVKGAKV